MIDSRALIFILSTFGILLALVIGYAVGSGEFFVPALTVVALGAITLTATPAIGAFLTVAFYASGLNAPGLPGQFGLYEILGIAVCGCALLRVIFHQSARIDFALAHRLALLFLLILLATGLQRGLGLRFLGGDLWGGFAYLKIALAVALVFLFPAINIPARYWPWALGLMGVFSMAPFIADLLVLRGYNYGLIRMFVQTGGMLANAVESQQIAESVTRVTSAGTTAWAMMLAFLALLHTRRLLNLTRLWSVGLYLAIIALSFISGFRLMTASLFVATLLLAWLQGTLTPPRVVLGAVVSLGGLLVIYQVADALPYNMQRVISWLPGIEISQTASSDASGTVEWRLDLWNEAVRDIPTYFLVGKGLAFNGEEVNRAVMMNPNGIDWALISGSYHNGYLSLLLLTGVAGLFLGLWLLGAIVWRHLKITRLPWNNPRLHQAHQAVLAFEITLFLTFLTIYGDIQSTFPQYFFFWMLMEALWREDRNLANTTSPSAAPQGTHTPPKPPASTLPYA